MSPHEATGWVVCYDIRERRRLLRVHRYMKKRGVPLQYSVVLVQASPAQLHRLMLELEDLIDASADDVRAYRFAPGAEYHCLGPSPLPEDVLLFAPHEAAPVRRWRAEAKVGQS